MLFYLWGTAHDSHGTWMNIRQLLSRVPSSKHDCQARCVQKSQVAKRLWWFPSSTPCRRRRINWFPPCTLTWNLLGERLGNVSWAWNCWMRRVGWMISTPAGIGHWNWNRISFFNKCLCTIYIKITTSSIFFVLHFSSCPICIKETPWPISLSYATMVPGCTWCHPEAGIHPEMRRGRLGRFPDSSSQRLHEVVLRFSSPQRSGGISGSWNRYGLDMKGTCWGTSTKPPFFLFVAFSWEGSPEAMADQLAAAHQRGDQLHDFRWRCL